MSCFFHHQNNPHRDMVKSPSLRAFKVQLDSMLKNVIRSSFSYDGLDLMIFWAPFLPGLFWGSDSLSLAKLIS